MMLQIMFGILSYMIFSFAFAIFVGKFIAVGEEE
jgi:hypothetical protein